MKSYSFKIYDEVYEKAIEKWVDDGYTIAGMVTELLAKYEGLQLPKPNEEVSQNIEINRQRVEIEKLKKDARETTEILISLISDIEKLKGDMAILPVPDQQQSS